MNTELPRILFVDDEENTLFSFRASFRRSLEIFTANSGAEAKKILDENEIHILIVDQRMPGMPGVELLEDSFRKYPDQVRILLTAYSDFETLKEAVNKGFIYKFLGKPWNDNELMDAIVDAYSLFLKNKNIKQSMVDIEQKMLHLENQVKQLQESLNRERAQIDSFPDKS